MDQKKVEEQLKRINKLYEQLGKSNPYAGMDSSKISSSIKEVEKLENALEGVESRSENLQQTFSDLQSQLRASVDEIKKGPDATKRLATGFRGVLAEVKKLTYEEEGFDKLNLNQLTSLKKRASLRANDAKKAAQDVAREGGLLLSNGEVMDSLLTSKRDLTDAQSSAIAYLRGEDETLQTINDKVDQRIKKQKDINSNLGITGALLKGAQGFMDKMGLGALSNAVGFQKINEELEEYAEELENTEGLTAQEKKTKVLAKSLSLLKGGIAEALQDPLVRSGLALDYLKKGFKLLSDGFKQSQETTGNIAKNLSITNGEAMAVSKSMSVASFGTDQLFVSSKGLGETLVAINSSLGTSVVLSNEQLATFTKLRETAGLTNEEMLGIYKLSLANGDSFDNNADSLINQVNALNKSSGLYVNAKEVLKDVNSLSAATTLSLGKNPASLAEAVTVAKSLGMEMSKIDAIAGSLLDFESSIENELQAELLLNKDLNLEKARQAALNNDLVTVATEIAKQAGSSAEFADMNRIKQEALAKAVGMSRDDLAETLFTQEAIAGASGDEAARREKVLNTRIKEVGLAQAQKEAQEGGLEAMLDQATAAEKMEASIGKIYELFTNLGAAFAPIVDMFASVAGWIMESKAAMVVLSGVIGGLGALLAIMGAKAAFLAVQNLIGAVGAIFTGMAPLGPFGIPLAIAGVAALGAGAMAMSSIGDLNSSADGKTQVSTKEGGLFELSKNDDIVAFPGASKMAEGTQGDGSTTVVQAPENKETNSLLAQLVMQNKKKPELSAVGLYEVQ
jgi:hypothetical protein